MCVCGGGRVGITDKRGNVGNVSRTRGQELEDFWPGSRQRPTQGCLSTHIWEDTAEQRFDAGKFKWRRLGSRIHSPGSCGVGAPLPLGAPPPSKLPGPSSLSASACRLSDFALPACSFHPTSFLVWGGFQPHLLSWSPVHPLLLPGIYQCHSE